MVILILSSCVIVHRIGLCSKVDVGGGVGVCCGFVLIIIRIFFLY